MSKRKRLKIIAIGLGICLLLLVLLISGALFYLETEHAQNRIQSRVNAAIPGTITWSGFEYSLLNGRVELKNAKLQDPDGEKLAGFKRLFVKIAPLALFGKAIRVESAILEKPQADLRIEADGTLNLLSAFPQGQAGPKAEKKGGRFPFTIVVEELRISDGDIAFVSVPADLKTRAQGLSVQGSGDLEKKRVQLKAAIQSGFFENPAVQTLLHGFEAEGRLEKGRLDPARLRLETDAGTLELSGLAEELFGRPRLDMALDLDISLDQLKKSCNLGPRMSGNATAQLAINGSLSDPDGTLQLRYGGGNLAGYQLSGLDLEAQLRSRRLDLKTAELRAPSGKLRVSGTVDMQTAFPQGFFSKEKDLASLAYALSLNGQKLDLSRIVPGKTPPKGVINADIQLNGQGIDPKKLAADLSLALSGDRISLNQLASPIDVNLEARAELKDGGARIHALDLEADRLRLSGTGRYHLDTQAMAAQLELNAPDLSKSLTPLGVGGISGDLALTADLSGSVRQPAFDFLVSGQSLGFQDIRIGDLDLDAALDTNGVLKIAKLDLKNQGSAIKAKGQVGLFQQGFQVSQDMPADLRLSLKNVQAGDFMQNAPAQGTLDADIKVTGTVQSPQATAALTAQGLAIGKQPVGDLDGTLRFARGTVHLDSVKVRGGDSAVNLSGQATILDSRLKPLSDPRFDLNLETTPLHLAFFLDPKVASGTITGVLHAFGSLNALQAEADLTAKGLNIANTPIGDLSGNLRYDKGTVYLRPLDVQNKDSALHAEGSLRVLSAKGFKPIKDPRLDLVLRSDSLILGDFLADMTGKLALDANIRGTVQKPTGTVTIQGKDLDFKVQQLASARIDADLEGERIRIRHLAAVPAPGERLTGSGWVSLKNQRFDLRLQSDGIGLGRIRALTLPEQTRGKLVLDISGKGRFDQPEVTGTLGLRDLVIMGKPARDFNLDLALKDQLATVRATLDFDLQGWYHLQKKDFSATISFDETHLTPYFQLANQSDLGGKVSGTIQARGNAARISKIQAQADLSDLGLDYQGMPLVQTEQLTLRYADQTATIPGLSLRVLEKATLDLKGTARINGPMDITATGDIPMEALDRFLNGALPGLRGRLILDAAIQGSTARPVPDGTVQLKDISFSVPGIAQTLKDLNGAIRITPDRILIPEKKPVTAHLDTGDLSLFGRVGLQAFKIGKMDLNLTGNAVPVSVPGMLELMADAELSWTGTLEKSLLSGKATLLSGRYYRDVNLNLLKGLKEVGRRKRKESTVSAPETEKQGESFLDTMALDVDIKRMEPFVVDNNVAELYINPDLRLYGHAGQPLLSGRAEVESGTLDYQRNTFDVEKGVVDFLNPYTIEPTLDIKAVTEVRKWTIYLTVSGTPDALDFKLRSQPGETHEDILSLLIFGGTAEELMGGEIGSGKAPAEMVAQIVAQTVGKDIKAATGLDILELEFDDDTAGTGGEESGDRVKVTMGKELSRRMTVKYSVESRQGETVQKAIAEYKFLENLLLSGYQDDQGTFGGKLQFRMEFR